jgi:hypothetical protein
VDFYICFYGFGCAAPKSEAEYQHYVNFSRLIHFPDPASYWMEASISCSGSAPSQAVDVGVNTFSINVSATFVCGTVHRYEAPLEDAPIVNGGMGGAAGAFARGASAAVAAVNGVRMFGRAAGTLSYKQCDFSRTLTHFGG